MRKIKAGALRVNIRTVRVIHFGREAHARRLCGKAICRNKGTSHQGQRSSDLTRARARAPVKSSRSEKMPPCAGCVRRQNAATRECWTTARHQNRWHRRVCEARGAVQLLQRRVAAATGQHKR